MFIASCMEESKAEKNGASDVGKLMEGGEC